MDSYTITSGVVTVIAVFISFIATVADASPKVSATPVSYIPSEDFTLRCVFEGDTGRVMDILSITIGSVGDRRKALAGISDKEGVLVLYSLKHRASASGHLNHTNFLDSYLDLHLNSTTCGDTGDYYCSMSVKDSVIVHAISTDFKYPLKEGASCLQINTPVGKGAIMSTHTLSTITLCVLLTSLLLKLR